jgi:DNA-binding IclR family transcriptional regulator
MLTPTLPAYETAIGKALLAFSPTSVVDRVVAEGMRTAKPLTSPDKLHQALSVIRLTQIATARDEYRHDSSAIAMPVFSGGGKVAAAVELTVREPGADVKSATGALTVACRSLSRQLATEFRGCGTAHSNGNGNGSTV